jgi:hypothetical protein
MAVLATQKQSEKEAWIAGVLKPLRRWSEPGYKGVASDDVEVMVMSYYMNLGLNLHHHCHILHAPSPPPSYSIWRQSCGRIIRFIFRTRNQRGESEGSNCLEGCL